MIFKCFKKSVGDPMLDPEVIPAKPKRRIRSFLFGLMVATSVAMSQVVPTMAADASAQPTLDTDVADMIIKLVKSVNTLFTVFPINIFLMGSLLTLGLSLFRRAKKTATN